MTEICVNCQQELDKCECEHTTVGSVVVGLLKGNEEICQFCGASRTALKEMIAHGGRNNLTIVNHILEGCPACKKALGD